MFFPAKKAKLVFFTFFIALLVVFVANFALARINDWNDPLNKGAGVDSGGLYNKSEGTTASAIANYVGKILLIAPFLGMIILIRLVWAGYLWMTARGNTEQVEAAQKTIRHAVIGLVIFVALYAIVYFVLSQLSNVASYKGF